MIVEDSDVISYRGFEAVGCFGMQLSVEPACGLCGNHKPNRFFGIERKRIVGGLAYARPFFVFHFNRKEVYFIKPDNILYRAAYIWKKLTNYRYVFTYGYKQRLYTINLTFSKEDFPHLAGFQYLKDVTLPRYNYSKIVDRILDEKIRYEQIIKGAQYEKMVKPRLEALVYLEDILNNDFFLFSYMPQMYPFTTTIKADYLISSHFEPNSFVFIIQATTDGDAKCDYLCCSAFSKGERDYEANQRPRAVLKKERIHIPTDTSTILLDELDASCKE